MSLGSLCGLFLGPDFKKHVGHRLPDFRTFYQRISEEGYCQRLQDTSIFNIPKELLLLYTVFILIGFILFSLDFKGVLSPVLFVIYCL